MDKSIAGYLLASLLERLESGELLSRLTTQEISAIRFAVHSLQGTETNAATTSKQETPAMMSTVLVVAPTPAVTEPPLTELVEPAAKPTLQTVGKSLDSTLGRATLEALLLPDFAPLPFKVASETMAPGSVVQSSSEVTPEELRPVALNVESLEIKEPWNATLMLCLDFGTAMSKAFAESAQGRYELELGVAAGYQGFLLPSTMFIGDDERVYFGQEALNKSQIQGNGRRKRLDSVKSSMSQGSDPDATTLEERENPHTKLDLTRGDAIRLYLAFFTDIAESALAKHEGFQGRTARDVKRRYARPCWPDAVRAKAADAKMREMMEQAQLLADTFSGQWEGGIALRTLKEALQKVRELGARPSYLVADGIPEPIAVAGGLIYESENLRDAYMVVDVGAGTTDFGVFIATRKSLDDDFVMHQLSASINGVMQAGDKVDDLLLAYIGMQEGINFDSAHGAEIKRNLSRTIREQKEVLFRTGRLEFALSDGSIGAVTKEKLLTSPAVLKFGELMQKTFADSLGRLTDSWLEFLSDPRRQLQVVVTGGGASLDMMQALARGIVDVRGYKIARTLVNGIPDWMTTAAPALRAIYPQLAVAIGGSVRDLPDVVSGPEDLKR